MQRKHLNDYALSKLTESALQMEKLEHAKMFLWEMKNQGLPIRTHYFWPLLVSYGKQADKAGIMNVLKMMNDMDCPANFETFSDYVLPYIETVDSMDFINDLQVVMCLLLYSC